MDSKAVELCRTDNFKKVDREQDVAIIFFVSINRDHPVAIKPHQQAPFSMEAGSNGALPNIKRNKYGRTFSSDVAYAEELNLQEAYNDVAPFPSTTYDIKMTVETESTVT